jgi:hypothetical protein
LGGPVAAKGLPELAARLFGASESILQDLGASLQPADKIEIDRYRDDVRAQLDESTFEKAWAEGRAMSLEDAVALALDENAA